MPLGKDRRKLGWPEPLTVTKVPLSKNSESERFKRAVVKLLSASGLDGNSQVVIKTATLTDLEGQCVGEVGDVMTVYA